VRGEMDVNWVGRIYYYNIVVLINKRLVVMKLIINERQYRLLIENENGVNPDGELFEMINIVPPFKWDKTFLRACKLEPGKYRGYYIDWDINLSKSDITELNYLVKVGGNLNLSNSKIESLSMLSKVEGYLVLRQTSIESLPMLKTVGDNLILHDTPITELPMLSTVGGDLYLGYSSITELPMLSTVGGELNLSDSSVKELPKLKTVGELRIDGTNIESLP
jgi:hypothetical protein